MEVFYLTVCEEHVKHTDQQQRSLNLKDIFFWFGIYAAFMSRGNNAFPALTTRISFLMMSEFRKLFPSHIYWKKAELVLSSNFLTWLGFSVTLCHPLTWEFVNSIIPPWLDRDRETRLSAWLMNPRGFGTGSFGDSGLRVTLWWCDGTRHALTLCLIPAQYWLSWYFPPSGGLTGLKPVCLTSKLL